MNYFVRIIDSGYDRNGNHINKVYLYHNIVNNQYTLLTNKLLDIGSFYKDKGYYRTQRTKEEILSILDKADITYSYVFE